MMARVLSLIGLPKLARLAFGLTLIFMLTPTSALAASASPTHQAATIATPHVFATAASCTKGAFFGLEPWYHYLPDNYFDGNCDLQCFNLMPTSDGNNNCGRSQSDLPLVLLAIIDDLLRVSGIIAVAFVVYGSVRYTTSQGSPDATSQAQTTVINALLGMAIAMIAILVVSYIGKALT